MLQPLISIAILFLPLALCQFSPDVNKKLETDLFQKYNRQHRPVKKEHTTVQVSIYMSISHVETVDEHEQTMKVHGHLWSTWTDEYLQWKPSEYNGTGKINVDAYKIWQPALALYNSARGNMWHLYMNGLPAMITNTGKVWASGSFSFHVTCRFDFSDWPYDEQECPIVISDWVYDLSRVNLSDPQNDAPWNKPSVRLNYDPIRQDEKKHVAGWEVKDTWRRHCYWGPGGCKEDIPEGQPEWYWSLVEFGVKLKRHAPYFGLTVIMPTIITCLLTLCSFWVDTPSMAVALLIFNVLLQGLFGWDLIRELPPGSGSVPKIVTLYGFNLSLTTFAFVIHVLVQYLETVLSPDLELPIQISSLPSKLKLGQLFQVKGLSFDPQLMLNSDAEFEDAAGYNSPLASLDTSNALHDEEMGEKEDESGHIVVPLSAPSTSSDDVIDNTSHAPSSPATVSSPVVSKTAHQLYTLRRFMFCIYALAYLITVPICLL